MKETMTSRERWLAVLQRRKPDRVPMDYRGTPEVTQRLMRHLGCTDADEMLRRLHVDRAVGVGPRYVGPQPPPGTDIFGCRFQEVDYGTGVYSECVHHPLAQYETLEQIQRDYAWPDPDWWDYSEIPHQLEGNEDYPVLGGGSEPFLQYKNLRSQQQAFMDLILHPDIVHFCLDKLFGLAYENTRRIYEQIPGQVLITYIAEDLGSQEALLMSREHIGEFLLPRMKRMIALAHQAGAFVFHHDDGAIRDILPDLVMAGIDVLDPVQWRCRGMQREGLKRDFGDKLLFHGAMDNQQTLAFGSVAQVRQEVRDNLRILGAGGGYILAPCHNIQPITAPGSIVAMYETGYAEGWT